MGAQMLVKVMGANFFRSLNSSVVTHLISYEHTGEIAEIWTLDSVPIDAAAPCLDSWQFAGCGERVGVGVGVGGFRDYER